MHGAPAVTFPVGRSRWHLRTLIFLWLLGLTGAVLVMLTPTAHMVPVGIRAGALAGIVLAGVLAWYDWKNAPSGRLQWDGEHWVWSGWDGAQGCRLSLLLDLQSLMLVRLRDASHRQVWLWLDGKPGDSQWLAMRRAVVASLRPARGRSTVATHSHNGQEGM